MIINAENMILGRIGSYAAKQLMLGEKVDIVNCEKAVISGSKSNVLGRVQQKRAMGGQTKGPYFPRRPDMFVRRSIRGMLPWKQPKGKEAYKRLMCYLGIPKEFEGKEMKTFEDANLSKLPNNKFITVGEISKLIGATKWQKS
jgi:large subunit ribosomal protein L13